MAATFEDISFAEGRSRRAYKGTYQLPLHKAGDVCVVKEFKDKFAEQKGDWDTEVKLQKKSIELAKKFNKATYTTRPIEYAWSDVWQVTKSEIGTPRLGDWVMVEDYIHGEWNKWNTNAGYVDYDTPTNSLHAFSHWTWANNGGKLLICDLQGVRYDDKYILTDPVINSVDEQYGTTDMGVLGINLFFSTHECTTFCSGLPKPSKEDIEAAVRKFKSRGVHKNSHTSYSSESEFSISYDQKERFRANLVSVPGLQTIEEEEEED